MSFIAAIPIIGELLKPIFEIIDKAIPDREAAEKMKHEIAIKSLEAQTQLQQGQIDINKQEAASQSVFVAGWRPAIGWTCAMALFWQFVGYDTTMFFLTLFGKAVVVPKLVAQENLMELVLAMLGLAGWRSFDKKNAKDK